MAAAEEEARVNWDSVQHSTAPSGTTWNFVPPVTPWRNGSPERYIQMLKASISRQVAVGRLLSPLEFQSVLHGACALANLRPIAVRSFAVDDYMAVTPRDLLLGMAPSLSRQEEWTVGQEQDREERHEARVSEVEQRLEAWWELFSHDAFPLLVPFRKWSKVESELDLGAVVLIQYAAKYAKDKYRMGRVVELLPGRDGLVRSARVVLRNQRRGAREIRQLNKAGTTSLVLPVQRLVILLPGSEQPKEIVDSLKEKKAGPRQLVEQEVRQGLRVELAEEEEEMLDL